MVRSLKVILVKRTKKEEFASSRTSNVAYSLKAVVLCESKGEVRGCISAYKIQKGKVSFPDRTKRLLKLEENDQVILTPLKGLL